MDYEEFYYLIGGAQTRYEVREVLSSLKVKDLKEIANHYSIYCSRKTKSGLIDSITEGTIGAKLRSEAIRGISLRR